MIKYLSILFLLGFVLSPFSVHADIPYASEMVSVTSYSNDVPANYVLVATSSGATTYVTDLIVSFDSATPVHVFCGNSVYLYKGNYVNTWNPVIHFSSPLKCSSAAVWYEALDNGSGSSRNAVAELTGYTQTDTRFNYPTRVSTSTASGGSGGSSCGTATTSPCYTAISQFDLFGLLGGFLMFCWAFTMYVFFFKRKNI